MLVEERFELGTGRLIDDVLGGRRWGEGHNRSIPGPPPACQLALIGYARQPGAGVRCYRAAMSIPLSRAALQLVDGRNYAVLATVNPDGSPRASVGWVGRDGDDLVSSTVEGPVKPRNMVRDPRVSVTVIDSADPENYVELRGRVSMTPDVGRRLDTQLSWKYDGKGPGEDRPGAVRVVVRMVVDKATGYAA